MAEATDFNSFVKDIAAGSDQARLALAQQLKQANLWTGKVTGKMDVNFYNALVKLESAFKQQVAIDKITGTPTAATRYSILGDLIANGGGDGTTKTNAQRYIVSDTQAAKTINAIASDLLDRKLTKAEMAKYTKLLRAAEKAQPAVTTTGTGYTTTQGGVDEEQFITEQLQGTTEAKTKRATDAYAVMMEELGGLR